MKFFEYLLRIILFGLSIFRFMFEVLTFIVIAFFMSL